MPYHSRAAAVLVRWRIVERALEGVAHGGPEAETLQAESMRLRDEYQALIQAARDDDRPEPPAFPDGSLT